MYSQKPTINGPVKLEPVIAPNLPAIKLMAKAIPLNCVGNKSTITAFIIPMQVPARRNMPINPSTHVIPSMY